MILHDFHDCIVRTTDIPWNYPPTQDAIVTTGIIPFLVGNPYKPSFVTVTELGVDRRYTQFIDVRRGTNTERRVVVRESADLIQRWKKQS